MRSNTGVPLAGRAGFTLIELMIVVAIVGILAAIAIPKFAELVRKSREGSTKGNLGAVRSALSIYYSDMEGNYPTDDLAALTVNGKYLTALPKVHAAPHHAASAGVKYTGNSGVDGLWWADTGDWAYWEDRTQMLDGRGWGDLWIGCHHTDTKGAKWTDY